MDHTKETSIVIRMNKEEAHVLNTLLEELKILRDGDCDRAEWNDIDYKVIQDMQDILITY